jgi:hypothetical protein
MALAEEKYFSSENITINKFDAPEQLAEQAVHSLELVAELAQVGLSFQFKGGNSLLLILNTPQRFSIDADIATDEPRERIEACLEKAMTQFGVFKKWTKRQHKTKPWLPLSSYFCFYNSVFSQETESFVMLDAQLTRSPYATHFIPVECGKLYTSAINVEIPYASSIIGDKLLTLGPKTLGIPIGKGKEAQRLKHVFDISILLSTHPELQEIKKSFFACIEHENKLQEKTLSKREVLDDTLAFCETVAPYEFPPNIEQAADPSLRENILGLVPFADHLFFKGYGWSNLRMDMARTAFVIAAACAENFTGEEFLSIVKKNDLPPEFYWEKTKQMRF